MLLATATAARTAGAAAGQVLASDPALTVDGFDADRVRQIIAAADLPEARKSELTSALDSAAADPARIPATLDQIRAALP